MNLNLENAKKKKKERKMEKNFFVSETIVSENVTINCLY